MTTPAVRSAAALRRRTLLGGALSLTAGLPAVVLSAGSAAADGSAAAGPSVLGCEEWGARPPKSPVKVLAARPQRIIVHHTATANLAEFGQNRAVALARAMQTYQMDTGGWIDTGQHFTLSRGAFVTEGRHESLAALRDGDRMVEGAHCSGQNTVAIGIENEGTYTSEVPPAEQYAALVALCAHICRQYGIRPYQIYGHRDFNSTQCPGDRLYALLPQLRADVAAVTGGDPTAPQWPLVRRGEVGERVRVLQCLLVQRGAVLTPDGAFGPATEEAVRAFQKLIGAGVDGVAGGQTWNQLCAPLAEGAVGEAVKAVQSRLSAYGFPTSADGVFGPGTRDRVVGFQAARSLPQDGVVDARTWSRLLV
ncbi:peptidoglycan-binding protein [Streptomyces bambusae]|uniref:peptidoglycan recognition protein family protein n=1 Tax=Streptomyces bambusae TaxID=1550616 RepID=UPI001CFED20E|nr:peptidoglycan-binding protein [Streptomyces bambusae]MCB5165037.1 peptidoglycan-binding protein [Streptomyces bambusae]